MGLNLSGDGYDNITASWSPVADADGYVIQWDDDSAFGTPAAATINSGATVTHQLTGLQEDTTYHVHARATRTGAAAGDWSATESAATTLQSPAQVMMVATAASDVAITVTWANAVRADGYRVEWGTASGSYTDRATTTGLSYTVTGLNPSTTHYLRVVSTRTGASDGRPSAEASATTDAALTPAPVTGLSVTALSDRELRATWNAATNATGYVVQWDTVDTFPDPDEALASGAGVIIERLMAETEYHVRVKGTRMGAPDGAYSTSASATTGDAQTRVWAERFPGGGDCRPADAERLRRRDGRRPVQVHEVAPAGGGDHRRHVPGRPDPARLRAGQRVLGHRRRPPRAAGVDRRHIPRPEVSKSWRA